MSKSRKEAGHSLRHTVPDTFCAAKKIIPDRATLHTQIWLWRRDSYVAVDEAAFAVL